MDRNTLTGLLLIALITIGYIYLTSPSQEELDQQKRVRDSIAQLDSIQQDAGNTPMTDSSSPANSTNTGISEEAKKAMQIDSLLRTTQDSVVRDSLTKILASDPFNKAQIGQEKLYVLENDLIKLTLSNKGGTIKSVEVKNYKSFDSLPLLLLNDPTSQLNYSFVAQPAIGQQKSYHTKDLFFETTDSEFSITGDSKKSFSFRLNAGQGRYFEQKYTLDGSSYLVDYDVKLEGFETLIPANLNYFEMDWQNRALPQEKSLKNARRYSSVYYKFYEDDAVDNLDQSGDDEEKFSSAEKIEWIGFKQQFFNATLLLKEKLTRGANISVKEKEEASYVKDMHAHLTLPFTHSKGNYFPMQFYFGPNKYAILSDMDNGMEQMIPLGWGPLFYVNTWLIIPIFNLLESWIGSYGIIILILTLIIKLLLSFFTYKSYLSSAKMRLLKPEIEAIKEKIKDPQKAQMETMKIYNQAGASPLGGCLPMLLQFPFLVSMFYFFPSSIELRQQSFLWADDLSSYDSVLTLPFEIPFYGDHVSLFTLLMTISTIIYTRMNSQMTDPTGQMAQMKWMQYLMPIIFLGIFNNFASGLTYYYFLSNIITFGQQYVIKRFIVDEEKLHKQIEEKRKKPRKTGGFQARLEKMARDAQKARTDQQKGDKGKRKR